MTRQIHRLYKYWKSKGRDSRKIARSWKALDQAEQERIQEEKREEFQTLIVKHSDNIEYRGFLTGFQFATMLWKEGTENFI